MEPDGMRNGSTTNERSTNTNRITGKKLTAYSTHHGTRVAAEAASWRRRAASWGSAAWLVSVAAAAAWARCARRRRNTATSRAQMTPVTTSSTKSISAKFQLMGYAAFYRYLSST